MTRSNPIAAHSVSGRRLTRLAELEAHYEPPLDRALIKELDHISAPYRTFIEHSSFVIVASGGPEGLDCSPRGDAPGFVRVVNDKTLLIPDRRGNNRLDTLRNLIRDPRIALLFLVPGVGETLRVNGRAEIVIDQGLRESFSVNGKSPRSVLVVTAERVYFQCQKAIVRSRLWDTERRFPRGTLPTAGDMLKAASGGSFDGKAYDNSYPEHMKKTLY